MLYISGTIGEHLEDSHNGRSGRPNERRGESYSVPYVEPLSDARTQLADFVSILLMRPRAVLSAVFFLQLPESAQLTRTQVPIPLLPGVEGRVTHP